MHQGQVSELRDHRSLRQQEKHTHTHKKKSFSPIKLNEVWIYLQRDMIKIPPGG